MTIYKSDEPTQGEWEVWIGNGKIDVKAKRNLNIIATILAQEPHAMGNANLIASAPTLKAENEKLKEQNAKILEALEAYAKYYLLTPNGQVAEKRFEFMDEEERHIAKLIESAIKSAKE